MNKQAINNMIRETITQSPALTPKKENAFIIDSMPPLDGTETITHDEIRLLDFNSLRRIEGEINGKTGLGAVMYAPNGKIDNLLVYPSDGERPFFATAYKSHALKIGRGSLVVAVLGLDNAHALSTQTLGNQDLTVLCLPEYYGGYFVSMVKKHAPKYVFTTHDKVKDLQEKIAGVNIISTLAELATALQSSDLDTLINDESTAHNSDEWGEIIPLETKGNIYNPYPVEAFGSLSPVVSAIATYAKTPCSMAGQSVLGVLSTIGQIFVNAPFGYGHKPASLYLLTESPSGGGKTATQDIAYKAVNDYTKQRYEQFKKDLAEYQTNLAGLKSKEKASYLAQTHPPKDDGIWIENATMEIIIEKYVREDTKNLSWVVGEASKFFGGYSMNADTKTSMLGELTDLWSRGKTERHRKAQTTPFTRAYNCRFTLDLSGQRIIIEPVMNDPVLNSQGFLARFLISAEPSLIGNRDWTDSQNAYKDPHLIDFWAKCWELLEKDSDCIERINMPFGKGARHHLALYQNAVESQQKKGQRLASLTAFASRMAENASRIATLFAFYDGKECVSIDELDRAFLLVEYSIKEVLNYNQRQSDNQKEYEILLNYLVKQSQLQGVERFLYSSIQSKTPKMLRKKEVFELAINTLVDTNHLKVIDIDGKRWIILNPTILQP